MRKQGIQRLERIKWIDIGRGIGILLVVLGHSMPSAMRSNEFFANAIYKLICAIHMPLLICLAGYSFKISFAKYSSYDTKTFLAKKAHRLLIPYITYSLIIAIIFWVLGAIPSMSVLMERFGFGRITFLEWFRLMLLGENKYAIHLWFLYDLFIYEIVLFFLFRNKLGKCIACIIAVIATILYSVQAGFIFTGVGVSQGVSFFIWFVIGTLISFDKLSNKCLLWAPVIWLTHNISLYVFNMKVPGSVFPYLISYFARFCAVLTIIQISKIIQGKISDVLSYFGRESIYIYLFHQPFIASCLGTVLYGILRLPVTVCIIITFCAAVIFPLIFVMLLRKFSFGKKLLFWVFGEKRG